MNILNLINNFAIFNSCNLLTVGSLFYSVLLIIVYFLKEKVKTIETKIYSMLIITNFVGIIIAIACYYTVLYNDYVPNLNYLVSRLYLIYLLFFILIFFFYLIITLYHKKSEQYLSKKENGILYILTTFLIIISCLVFILPLYYHNTNGEIYSYGPSANVIYIFATICMSIWSLLLFINGKKVKDKRLLPIIIFIVGAAITTIIQKINPSLLLMTSMETFVTVLMYFTIENPDLAVAEELEHQKHQIEEAKNVTNRVINTISKKMGDAINKFEEFGSMEIDYSDSKKVKEIIKEMQKTSTQFANNIDSTMELSRIQSVSHEIKNENYELKQLLFDVEKLISIRNDNVKVIFNGKEDIPPVLYGDPDKIKACIIYLYSGILKISKVKQLDFNYSYLTVGGLCRFKLKINIDSKLLNDDTIIKKDSVIDFEVVNSIIKILDGKFEINYVKDELHFEISIDQKNLRGYYIEKTDVENKNVEYYDLSNTNILIVDDDIIRVEKLISILKKYNVNIKSAYTKEEIMKKTDEIKFDLVFVDDIIPNLEDIKLFFEVDNKKKISRLVDHISYDIVRVIMVTPNTKDYETDYIDEGFNDYITKPISEEKINKILSTYIKR